MGQFRTYDSYSYRYTTAMYTMARGVPESASQTNFAELFYTELQEIASTNKTNTTGEVLPGGSGELTKEFLADGGDVSQCSDLGKPSESHTGLEAGFLVIFSAASALLFGYIVAHMT